MKKIGKLIFPLIAIIIFITLLIAFNAGGAPAGQQGPVGMGLLAYAIAITEVFISIRPKQLEKSLGLGSMYSVHGMMAIILVIVAIAHAGAEIGALKMFEVSPGAAPSGFLALLLFILTTFTGLCVLTNKLRKKPMKREKGLVLHRLSLLAIILIFIHMMSISFVRANTALVLLSAIYLILAVGGYVYTKVKNKGLPRYKLTAVDAVAPSLFRLEFAPESGKLMSYQSGQFLFVTFRGSALAEEAHPFSISSAPGGGKLEMIVKKSGDFTKQLGSLKRGDSATLEGPYGNFWKSESAASSSPLVYLAGGIGITPILSIIRSLKKTNRKQILFWGLSTRDDLILLDELENLSGSQDFTFHICFSKESVDGFDKGHITKDYLEKNGVDQLWQQGEFFICGPAPMMASMKSILKEKGVAKDKVHIEEFSF